MKRLIVLVLACGFLFSTVGCSDTGKGTKTGSTQGASATKETKTTGE